MRKIDIDWESGRIWRVPMNTVLKLRYRVVPDLEVEGTSFVGFLTMSRWLLGLKLGHPIHRADSDQACGFRIEWPLLVELDDRTIVAVIYSDERDGYNRWRIGGRSTEALWLVKEILE